MEVYTQMTKKTLVWCLRFGGCQNLGHKGVNVSLPSASKQ